jgi:hypothetical protein
MTEAQKELLKLIVAIGLVVLWMLALSLGWNDFWPLPIVAGLIRIPYRTWLQRRETTWLTVRAIIVSLLVIAWIFWLSRITMLHAKEHPPGLVSVVFFGVVYIVMLVDQWRRDRKAIQAAQL